MLDIDTCIDKLHTIKSTIGSGDNLFDSTINYLRRFDPYASDDSGCKHKDVCPFFDTVSKYPKKNPKCRAFNDIDTEYYELLIDIGRVKRGTIFYYDPKDDIRGSIGAGCLKLAWSEDGNCQCGLCADTIVFHASMREDTNLFKRAYEFK